LAKPLLEQDSHAKVQMRKKVRGLRSIEKQVLEGRRKAQAEPVRPASAAAPREDAAALTADASLVVGPPASGASLAPAGPALREPAPDEAGQVVLDYCAAGRGILSDDQGGPLPPPGLRMAQALQEVRASLQRNLDAKKGGAVRSSCVSSRAASRGVCRK